MKYGAPIDCGNCLTGFQMPVYVQGRDFDFIYRQTQIKAVSDYSAFYIMCPLEGPVYAGATLTEAARKIDADHAAEGATLQSIDVPLDAKTKRALEALTGVDTGTVVRRVKIKMKPKINPTKH